MGQSKFDLSVELDERGDGTIEGRQAWVIAYDFTVLAGSMGQVGEQQKAARVRELALRYRQPIVWLLDSAGARIQEAMGSTFAARVIEATCCDCGATILVSREELS